MNHCEDFNRFRKILIDECHLVNPFGGQYRDFIAAVNGRQVIGLTATPYRLGQTIDPKTINSKWKKYGSILKFLTRTRPRIFDNVLYHCQIKTLLDAGFLAKLRYFDMNALELDNVKLNSTGADYDDKSLFKEFERVGFYEYTLNIVKRVMRPKDGSLRHGILVFCRFVEDAERLADELCGFCEVVSGATKKKEREAILERFKSGETEVVANVGVLTCLSNDTEILTRNGWKGVDTINENDLVAQYENEIVTFDKPLRIIKKKHSGDFVTVKGRYMNIRITDDHTMLYRKRARVGLGDERRAKAKDLVGQKVFIPLSGNCEPENIEPEQPSVPCSRRRFINYNAYNYRKKGLDYDAAEKKAAELYERRLRSTYKKPNELTLEECLFIGFWLGDGSSSGGRYSVTQSLGTPKMCEWIEDLLKAIGIHYTVKVYKGKETYILGRKAHVSGHKTFYFAKGTGGDGQEVETNLTRLLPYLKKGGTDLYWGLSKEQILSLCKGLFMADGWHGDNRQSNYVKFVSADIPLIDLLQAICTCRGLCVQISRVNRDTYRVPFFNVSVRVAKYHQMVNETLALEKNNTPERVWCVTMPKGTIVTRRGGRVAILGNCGFDFPALDTIILARPTMSLALYYQMCLSMDTEVLTNRGFLKYSEIEKADKVAAYNNGTIVWTEIEDIVHRKMYNGEQFVSFANQHLNFCVTGYHELLVKRKWQDHYKKVNACDVAKMGNTIVVPVAGEQNVPDCGLKVCELKFLGFFLSDGGISKANNQIHIVQSYRYPEIIDEIERTIQDCGMKYSKAIQKRKGREAKYYDVVHFCISKGKPRGTFKDLKGWEYLSEYIDKDFGAAYEKLSSRDISILLYALNLGDGKKSDCGYERKTYTIAMGNNKVYADRVQSLAIRRGWRCNMYTQVQNGNVQYICHFKQMDYSTIAGQNVKPCFGKERQKITIYQGSRKDEVWCVKDKYGTIVTRRNGKVLIMGNCGRAIRPYPGKDGWVIDLCGSVAKFGKVEDLWLDHDERGGWIITSNGKQLTNIIMTK